MYTENIIFSCISWERSSLAFCPRKKYRAFGKKNTILPDNTRKIMSRRGPFWKDLLFGRPEENIIFPCIFLKRIIFHFPSKVKIIFSWKRNMIFPNNTRKIIFQRNFFGKTIFSGRLEKETMVFRAAITGIWKIELFNFFRTESVKNNPKKKFENHSKPPKLGSRSLFKQFQQIPNVFLFFYWNFKQNQTNLKSIQNKSTSESRFKQYPEIPNILLISYWNFNPFAPFVQLEESQYRPTFGQQCLQNVKNKHCLRGKFFKEYSTSFLMVCRLIEFALVYLKLLVFKVCVIIGILQIDFFNFSRTERVKKNQKNSNNIRNLLSPYVNQFSRDINKFP